MRNKKSQNGIESPDEFLNRVLSPSYIEELMDGLGHEIRDGMFHPAMVTWLMMYQRLSCGCSLTSALEAFRNGAGGVLAERGNGGAERASVNTGGFSQARTRLPEKAVNEIADTINQAIIGSHREHLWNGRHAYILDGTDFRVLAEGDLKKEYPPCRDSVRSSPWSIIRSVLATHVITGVALKAAVGPMYGPKAVGEVGLSKNVIAQLPANSIIIADKGFGTFFVAYTAINEGHDVLLRLTDVRAKQALNGRVLKVDGELPCTWNPAKVTQQSYPAIPNNAELCGRIIKHTYHPKGSKPVKILLFTTLDLPVEQIVSLYALRWNIETDLRTIKTTMKMELLDVRSASMARKEIALGIAAYNMVRHLLAYAAHEANILPRRISFTHFSTRIRFVGMRLANTSNENERKHVLNSLTSELQQMAHPVRKRKRPSRPRKVLRHPQPFPSWTSSSRKNFQSKKKIS